MLTRSFVRGIIPARAAVGFSVKSEVRAIECNHNCVLPTSFHI